MKTSVRPYTPADRAAVRRICADTGFMGDPIDSIFSDREVFADFFTRYYTDHEPEWAMVSEDEETGEVVGYILGSVRVRFEKFMQPFLLITRTIPVVLFRYLTGRYNKSSRRFLYWVVFKSIRETPPAPKNAAHFHVNLLPAYRSGRGGRGLVFTFFKRAQAEGVNRIYGQIQTGDDRRSAFWKRYGFNELSRRRITKFDRYHSQPVYVSTLFRDFGQD